MDKAEKIYSEIEDHAGMIWVLDHRGGFFYLDGNYEIAFSLFSKALDTLKKYHIVDAQLEFRLHDHLATTLMRMQGQQHIEEALRHFQEAIALSEKVDSYSKAMIRMDFGSALFSIGRFADAVTTLKDSLVWSEPNGYQVLIFHAYRQLGKISWSVDHNAQQAAAYYDKSIDSIEKNAFANKNLNEEARLGLFSDLRIIFEEFLDILAALEISEPSGKWGHKAFEVSERMKSREFLQALQKNNHAIASQKNDNIELLATQQQPVSVEEIQKLLRPDQALLSYAVTNNKTFIFIITRNKFELLQSTVTRTDLQRYRIPEFRKGLFDAQNPIDLKNFDPGFAYSLYQLLFQPVEKNFKGIASIYVAADDVLYTVPFETLVSQSFDRQSFMQKINKSNDLAEYGSLHYLVEDYTFTYLPSASVLVALHSRPKPSRGSWSIPFIAFVDPVFDADGKNGNLSLPSLPRLKESGKEAEGIASVIKGKHLIYPDNLATEDNVFRAPLDQARYILFSTHGMLAGEFGGNLEPGLVLSRNNNPPNRDGFLTMSEILTLKLNAEVVVLSACQTAAPGEYSSVLDANGFYEGFSGLTRAFMLAGAQSLLVAHWKVDSEPSRRLIVRAFELLNSSTRSQALHKAKLELKKQTAEIRGAVISMSHPFYWGAFVLVGEAQ